MIRTTAFIAASVLCAASFAQILFPPRPVWIYNPSPSAPVGWYRLHVKAALVRDVKVAAFAPAEARNIAAARGYLPEHVPLIKTIWAKGGDRICSENGVITAPNRPDISAAGQDGLGRRMPQLDGCFTLKRNEYFLVSTDVQTSWDSRYFGPVSRADVLGVVIYEGEDLGAFWRFNGRARALGVEGKIKGGSAPLGLFPCLHIIFGGTPVGDRGAPFLAVSPVRIGPIGGAPSVIGSRLRQKP